MLHMQYTTDIFARWGILFMLKWQMIQAIQLLQQIHVMRLTQIKRSEVWGSVCKRGRHIRDVFPKPMCEKDTYAIAFLFRKTWKNWTNTTPRFVYNDFAPLWIHRLLHVKSVFLYVSECASKIIEAEICKSFHSRYPTYIPGVLSKSHVIIERNILRSMAHG